jgi:hypothetical protein
MDMPVQTKPLWRMPGSQLCCLIGRNRTARKRFALMQAEAWPLFRYAAPTPRRDPIAIKRYKREQRAHNA